MWILVFANANNLALNLKKSRRGAAGQAAFGTQGEGHGRASFWVAHALDGSDLYAIVSKHKMLLPALQSGGAIHAHANV